MDAPHEAVDFLFLLHDRKNNDFDDTDTFLPDRTGAEIISELHARMLHRAFMEKPVRFLAIMLGSFESDIRYGKTLMEIYQKSDINMDTVDLGKIKADLEGTATLCSQAREMLKELGTEAGGNKDAGSDESSQGSS